MLGRSLALLCCSATLACAKPEPPPPWADLQRDLAAQLVTWLERGELVRDDGFVYAVDVGQLLIYAALAGDQKLYDALHARVRADFVVDDPSDPFTQGFVAWRRKLQTPIDASGTTEALRVARGLALGAEAFARPADLELARTIHAGYGRHARTDQDIWFIANYFKFDTRHFVTNSYLVDYDPDLTRELDAPLHAQVKALVDKAAAPTGLIYDVVQPEVLTLMPHFTSVAFSPNDVIQVSNSCVVAERAATSSPALAKRVLAFATARLPALQLAYYGRTGEPAGDKLAGLETAACLARLALKVGDLEQRDAALAFFARHAREFTKSPWSPRLYLASEALLTLQCVNSGGGSC